MRRRKVTASTPPSWVLVVRESASRWEREVLSRAEVMTPGQVHRLVWPRIAREDVEVMYLVALDGQNHVRHLGEVARGGLHGCGVTARDVLRLALWAGASSYVLIHNHPSGDPTPSDQDKEMTRRLDAASQTVGIPLSDHVIVAGRYRWFSFLDAGLLDEEATS